MHTELVHKWNKERNVEQNNCVQFNMNELRFMSFSNAERIFFANFINMWDEFSPVVTELL